MLVCACGNVNSTNIAEWRDTHPAYWWEEGDRGREGWKEGRKHKWSRKQKEGRREGSRTTRQSGGREGSKAGGNAGEDRKKTTNQRFHSSSLSFHTARHMTLVYMSFCCSENTWFCASMSLQAPVRLNTNQFKVLPSTVFIAFQNWHVGQISDHKTLRDDNVSKICVDNLWLIYTFPLYHVSLSEGNVFPVVKCQHKLLSNVS